MNDIALCNEINALLPEGWEPFSPTGDGCSVQGYLKAGGFGVWGEEGDYTVIYAEDAIPFTNATFDNLDDACRKAAELAARS